jgi:hypothetical protein
MVNFVVCLQMKCSVLTTSRNDPEGHSFRVCTGLETLLKILIDLTWYFKVRSCRLVRPPSAFTRQ